MSVKQLFDLTGQVALVTGGSRGLGLQMAQALGEMGARLAITARKADELAQARAQLEGLGYEVVAPAAPIGGGQAIWIDWEQGTLQGGSDPRKDGCALGY